MSTLLQRVATAAVLLAILVGVFFFLPPFAVLAFLGLFVLLGAWEWSAFFAVESVFLRVAYAGFILAAMLALNGLLASGLSLVPVLWTGIAWWLVALLWVLRYPTPIRRDVGAVCGALVLLPAWAALLIIFAQGERGPAYVLLLLCMIWAADIGAYFTGRQFGRMKLAPDVSPGKTWEGVIGGLLAAAAAAAGGAAWFGLDTLVLVAAGISVAAVSIVGDLTVSMFKRHAGLKDSGRLFPGHGGVLDRVDSVTAGLPLFVLEAAWIGIIGP